MLAVQAIVFNKETVNKILLSGIPSVLTDMLVKTNGGSVVSMGSG